MGKNSPLFIVPFRCTFGCDSNCVHCTSGGKQAAIDEVDTIGAKYIIDQISAFGATFFGLTGGEPLLRKDLPEIIAYAKQKGLRVSLITDAHKIDGATFKMLKEHQVRISISIDGSEKTNDAIRGKGAYKAALFAIENFSKAELLDCLVCTFAKTENDITNVNKDDIVHVIELARKNNARWAVFHGFIPFSKKSIKADPTPQQYEWACNTLYDLMLQYKNKPEINVYIPFMARIAKQRGMPNFDDWYNNFFLGRCWFGKFLSIAENGEAIPCSYNDIYRSENIKTKPLQQIWQNMENNEFFAKARDKNNLKGKCAICEYKQICGGCRTTALFYTDDIHGSDPRCPYIPTALNRQPK
ncbi:MAG: radical SAM protein [Candidatus Bathyarchaeota archaeon]|uniref:radical SAM/SPASM domain-containing protein n=1 Tax=Candidatus Bathycorpusculum sp. TaxID=2994959 RepID=UPI00283A48CA|nr:radical SAM protein [Candidatus Termiticorpusculum sp.]MCL2257752.1 radical SAM protein [Candidatus Termiticorpusculum sp.]MCL2292115.1 radical SAM protein [Candidatus Termiticorpusculum sp.]